LNNILNITNGDNSVELMKLAEIPGEYLPWRDVLHDGPVPEQLSFDELAAVRAQFISDCGWGDYELIKQDFEQRNHLLESMGQYDKVMLWFEHDLYDQLQILQILDWLHQQQSLTIQVTLICTNQYLGFCSPDELKALLKYEAPITPSQLSLASLAWDAFRSPTPEKWCDLLQHDCSDLPFLRDAVLRMLQEYPSVTAGLSRTAHQALSLISKGEQRPGKLFGTNQAFEDAIFMGDASFYMILNELIQADEPLVQLNEGSEITFPINHNQRLSLTPLGKAVLNGEAHWLDHSNINRWIGGIHLTADNIWCWDSANNTVVQQR
jgi:hypothetical protein